MTPHSTFFQRIAGHYYHHFNDIRRERQFIASISFLVTFLIVRGVTYSIYLGIGWFHNVTAGGKHIHHLVWGILFLLLVGYLWLLRVGSGDDPAARAASRMTATLYGLGAALTLDEFALWLNLEDVYWAHEGRESIDAVMFFGALLSIGLWGGRFFRVVAGEILKLSQNRV
jgi:hypothetical protein